MNEQMHITYKVIFYIDIFIRNTSILVYVNVPLYLIIISIIQYYMYFTHA